MCIGLSRATILSRKTYFDAIILFGMSDCLSLKECLVCFAIPRWTVREKLAPLHYFMTTQLLFRSPSLKMFWMVVVCSQVHWLYSWSHSHIHRGRFDYTYNHSWHKSTINGENPSATRCKDFLETRRRTYYVRVFCCLRQDWRILQTASTTPIFFCNSLIYSLLLNNLCISSVHLINSLHSHYSHCSPYSELCY